MLCKNNKKIFSVIVFLTLFFSVSGCMEGSSSQDYKADTALDKVPMPAESKIFVNNQNIIKDIGSRGNKVKVYGYGLGDKFLNLYKERASVRQIILVEQAGNEKSVGKLFLLAKENGGNWTELLQCKAYLGKNGIEKIREGDARTPTGDYGFLMAFGAKDDPGSQIPYTKLTDSMYLCGDKEYYNQFIDVSSLSHRCSSNSEHLLSYVPQYNYALFMDYNKERVYGKGSGIFLHCFGNYSFTLGCVSVAEENMIKILRTIDSNARICIYAKE